MWIRMTGYRVVARLDPTLPHAVVGSDEALVEPVAMAISGKQWLVRHTTRR